MHEVGSKEIVTFYYKGECVKNDTKVCDAYRMNSSSTPSKKGQATKNEIFEVKKTGFRTAHKLFPRRKTVRDVTRESFRSLNNSLSNT